VALLAQGEDNAVVVRAVRVRPPAEVVHDDHEGAAEGASGDHDANQMSMSSNVSRMANSSTALGSLKKW
jgi:hypothetical protein